MDRSIRIDPAERGRRGRPGGILCVFAHAPILPDSLTPVVIASFPAGPLAANCYLLASEPGSGCVIIDPGMDAAAGVDAVVTEQRLRPEAVLLTHGHYDHVASAARVAARYDAGCWIHPDDRAWLSDPMAGLTPEFAPLLANDPDATDRREPERMLSVDLTGPTGRLRAAGLDFELIPAHGHTPGSTLFRTRYRDLAGEHDLLFTGDVLFEGTIGRTDLPGGDQRAMERTLASTVLSLPDEVVVLPGHGGQSTIGRERAGNRFLPHH
jgi:hydroxyacylglutathione hydrolase